MKQNPFNNSPSCEKKTTMTLNDVQKTPIIELIQKMDLAEIKVHSNDAGYVCSIELKYIPGAGQQITQRG